MTRFHNIKVVRLDQEIIEISIISIHPSIFILKVTIYIHGISAVTSFLKAFGEISAIAHQVYRHIGTICYSGVNFVEISITDKKPLWYKIIPNLEINENSIVGPQINNELTT